MKRLIFVTAGASVATAGFLDELFLSVPCELLTFWPGWATVNLAIERKNLVIVAVTTAVFNDLKESESFNTAKTFCLITQLKLEHHSRT